MAAKETTKLHRGRASLQHRVSGEKTVYSNPRKPWKNSPSSIVEGRPFRAASAIPLNPGFSPSELLAYDQCAGKASSFARCAAFTTALINVTRSLPSSNSIIPSTVQPAGVVTASFSSAG